MDMRKVIGSNFARLRKSKGLTQEAVAEKSGFSQSYIGWLERGQRNPTAISIWMLAQAIDAMPADLVQPIDENA
ncbi:helix-turn-helix transcriptional regulator [Sphingomonas oligophenolica]|uniref:Helix-turn-helix transcriptional regulator n=1 Tax=Sphingomonas oligophenolica TaxID=301154 RepID=A0ABU9Y6E6_9SPHN